MRIWPLLLVASCWHGDPDVSTPAPTPKRTVDLDRATYDADVDTVFAAALETTRARYPNLVDDPGKHTISTAWHQFAPEGDDPTDDQRFFARYEIAIVGPPWAIDITPRLSAWKAGDAKPHELGIERAWLVEATRTLRREIHARLQNAETKTSRP